MRKTKITKTQHFVVYDTTQNDLLAELVVSYFDLDQKNREQILQDEKQCFVLWWSDNQKSFYKYKSITALAELLKCHHATVIHHMRTRQGTLNYLENVKDISDFIEGNR